MTKTQNNIRNKAIDVRKEVERALVEALRGYGDISDQLRVMGYVGEALMNMAESELKIIQLADEADKPKIQVAVH